MGKGLGKGLRFHLTTTECLEEVLHQLLSDRVGLIFGNVHLLVCGFWLRLGQEQQGNWVKRPLQPLSSNRGKRRKSPERVLKGL